MPALCHLRGSARHPPAAILTVMTQRHRPAEATVRVPARVSLAGNPSDGYGGAVVATCLWTFAAEVTVGLSDGPTAPQNLPLAEATRTRFDREIAHKSNLSAADITVDTTIPRSVGLAGSSAIVTATIRALASYAGVTLPPGRIAAMTHAIERTDLDIAGGWQDEIMQAHQGTRLMRFDGAPRHRELTPTATRSIPLYLAWQPTTAQASSIPHGNLAQRNASTAGGAHANIAAAMVALAEEARRAADAIEHGDVHVLKDAMNQSFDLRASIMPIEPAHQAMIDAARRAGAAANFSGSGGAIVGVVPKDPDRLLEALDDAGLSVTTWDLAAPPQPVPEPWITDD